ncbi:MAG: PP2C family protein-serine/threonine phosphatase [bacterium]
MSVELLLTICYLLAGGFLIFLAVTVTRDNFSNRLNRATGAMLLFAGIGPVLMALGTYMTQPQVSGDSTLYNLRHLWELFFPSLLLFSWLFPVDRLAGFRRPRLRYVVFFPQLMHVILILLTPQILKALDLFSVQPDTQGFSRVILDPLAKVFSWLRLLVGAIRTYEGSVFAIINLAYVGLAVYFLESGRKLVTNPRISTQTRWVLWGTRLSLGIYVLAQISALLFPHWMTSEATSLSLVCALLIGAVMFILATVRHQFLDVQQVFRQSFVNTITSALLVGSYVAIVIQLRPILTPIFGENAEMVSYGLIVVMLLFFQPINNWLDNLVRSMFIRTRTDHRNVLERFSRQVISIVDPRQLRQIIDETLKTTLLVDRVYFCLYDDSVEEYVLLPSEDYPQRYLIDRHDLMLRGINLLGSPTYYHSLTGYRDGSDLAAVMEGRAVRMILPLKDADHMLGFVALTGKAAGYRYSSDDISLLGVLSNQMVSALTVARLYVESMERLRLQEEVSMARQIQVDLLPSKQPELTCAEIFSQSTPSRTIGGDFYDFITMPDHRLGVVIADASGKGMPAALMIAQTQAIIRNEVSNGNPISSMLKRTNQQIVQSTSAEKYVTLFYGELDTLSGVFRYANAGHNYPILARATGEIEHLKTGGPIIGAFPFMEYESASVTLQPDDFLFLFTDGLSEAMNEQDEEFGEERLASLVSTHRGKDPRSLVEHILRDVMAHDPTDPPRDDTTVVALRMKSRA